LQQQKTTITNTLQATLPTKATILLF